MASFIQGALGNIGKYLGLENKIMPVNSPINFGDDEILRKTRAELNEIKSELRNKKGELKTLAENCIDNEELAKMSDEQIMKKVSELREEIRIKENKIRQGDEENNKIVEESNRRFNRMKKNIAKGNYSDFIGKTYGQVDDEFEIYAYELVFKANDVNEKGAEEYPLYVEEWQNPTSLIKKNPLYKG